VTGCATKASKQTRNSLARAFHGQRGCLLQSGATRGGVRAQFMRGPGIIVIAVVLFVHVSLCKQAREYKLQTGLRNCDFGAPLEPEVAGPSSWTSIDPVFRPVFRWRVRVGGSGALISVGQLGVRPIVGRSAVRFALASKTNGEVRRATRGDECTFKGEIEIERERSSWHSSSATS